MKSGRRLVMPYFLNTPITNNSFTEVANYKYFVDKSELIDKVNECIDTPNKYICITRPRRFGKTINAMMLAAYYSKNADFKGLFDNLKISESPSYLEHLNKHNVIYITFNANSSNAETYKKYIDFYKDRLIRDITENYPNIPVDDPIDLILQKIFEFTKKGFIFVIDEWDYIFNNNLFSNEDRESFLQFLKDLLKDKPYVELAYMTGVLPIAKYSSGSALNMFVEFNIMNDHQFDKYFGFTHDEVEDLCKKQSRLSMAELKDWYNGYRTCNNLQVYNPRSVALALNQGVCQSYWTNTGPLDEILYYINQDIDAVENDIVQMTSGIPVKIKLKGYGAEQINLNNRNQILSAMTVYGFLSYYDKTLQIPNKELRIKFDETLEDKSMGEISKVIMQSNEMLDATLRKDTVTMERIIQETHDINIPVIKYGDENSLSCVVTLAYLAARDDYKIIREMPAGIGFADFIFYPNNKSKPAFIIELKKDTTPDEALKQIHEKRYALALKDYTGQKLAVGISYDSKTKTHKVKIKDIE